MAIIDTSKCINYTFDDIRGACNNSGLTDEQCMSIVMYWDYSEMWEQVRIVAEYCGFELDVDKEN